MYLYNSASHKKKNLSPTTPSSSRCTPAAHGHLFILPTSAICAVIMEDVLEKYLRYVGYPSSA